jgi:glucose-6-phosphate isomerase
MLNARTVRQWLLTGMGCTDSESGFLPGKAPGHRPTPPTTTTPASAASAALTAAAGSSTTTTSTTTAASSSGNAHTRKPSASATTLTAAKKVPPSAASVIEKHMVAVSTNRELVTKFGISPSNIFEFWDFVGGRYSVTSAVGILPLALHFGYKIVEQFLAGARSIDNNFFTAAPRSNLALLMGLVVSILLTFAIVTRDC